VTLLLLDEQRALQEAALCAAQHTLHMGCSLGALFDALPKLWTQEQFDCVKECLPLL
jgi:hypothetical protein